MPLSGIAASTDRVQHNRSNIICDALSCKTLFEHAFHFSYAVILKLSLRSLAFGKPLPSRGRLRRRHARLAIALCMERFLNETIFFVQRILVFKTFLDTISTGCTTNSFICRVSRLAQMHGGRHQVGIWTRCGGGALNFVGWG
jgi:hypothetical protein